MGVDSKRKDGNYLLTTCIPFTPTSKSPKSIDLLADFGDMAHIISATLKRVAGAYHMLNEMPSRSFTPPKVVSNPESLHWHVILSFIISKFTGFDVGYGDKGEVASKFGDSSEHFWVPLSLEKRGNEWEISKETHEERALNFTCDKLENPQAVLEGTRCLAAVVSSLTDAYEVFNEVPTRRWVYSDVNPKVQIDLYYFTFDHDYGNHGSHSSAWLTNMDREQYTMNGWVWFIMLYSLKERYLLVTCKRIIETGGSSLDVYVGEFGMESALNIIAGKMFFDMRHRNIDVHGGKVLHGEIIVDDLPV